MHVCHSIDDVRAVRAAWREARERVAFVPTMGSLHEGHLRLVRVAREYGARVAASVFVNPLQFGPHEDFAAYPRQPEADAQALREAGADLLFAPDEAQMYPFGREGALRIEVPPALGDILCGAARPGHFAGVATVVAKLLHVIEPEVGLFGEKDYQQLLVVRRLVQDLHLPVNVIGVPTVRAPDGLALSSRNAYLSPAERERAPALYQTLQGAAAQLGAGVRDFEALARAGTQALLAAGMEPEYFSVRRLEDLGEPDPASGRYAVLAAAWLGRTRLIDNVLVGRH